MAIMEFIPATGDNDSRPTALDMYCDDCELSLIEVRQWTLAQARELTGKFMTVLPQWAQDGIPVHTAIERMQAAES